MTCPKVLPVVKAFVVALGLLLLLRLSVALWKFLSYFIHSVVFCKVLENHRPEGGGGARQRVLDLAGVWGALIPAPPSTEAACRRHMHYPGAHGYRSLLRLLLFCPLGGAAINKHLLSIYTDGRQRTKFWRYKKTRIAHRVRKPGVRIQLRDELSDAEQATPEPEPRDLPKSSPKSGPEPSRVSKRPPEPKDLPKSPSKSGPEPSRVSKRPPEPKDLPKSPSKSGPEPSCVPKRPPEPKDLPKSAPESGRETRQGKEDNEGPSTSPTELPQRNRVPVQNAHDTEDSRFPSQSHNYGIPEHQDIPPKATCKIPPAACRGLDLKNLGQAVAQYASYSSDSVLDPCRFSQAPPQVKTQKPRTNPNSKVSEALCSYCLKVHPRPGKSTSKKEESHPPITSTETQVPARPPSPKLCLPGQEDTRSVTALKKAIESCKTYLDYLVEQQTWAIQLVLVLTKSEKGIPDDEDIQRMLQVDPAELILGHILDKNDYGAATAAATSIETATTGASTSAETAATVVVAAATETATTMAAAEVTVATVAAETATVMAISSAITDVDEAAGADAADDEAAGADAAGAEAADDEAAGADAAGAEAADDEAAGADAAGAEAADDEAAGAEAADDEAAGAEAADDEAAGAEAADDEAAGAEAADDEAAGAEAADDEAAGAEAADDEAAGAEAADDGSRGSRGRGSR
ncbi:nascent polypeptide-associated complex subunit alpha, muscle-specific form-like [Sarcophilus harrisii]|uniref:nascent polypeptide-associated complex subunit alpha, muscle-specific form-like n=1 Tax=Sarcophilus harrisii TaxID=9305 RepID=UPI001301FB21|nr:nascent polypeptide-associated complex subunit alpha, muscle-specific form-like [Sarcophilus harrisii]